MRFGTKEAIIRTAAFDEKYKKAKEEIGKEEEVQAESFDFANDFNPDDIQPLVSRKPFGEDEEREDDEDRISGLIHFDTDEKEIE